MTLLVGSAELCDEQLRTYGEQADKIIAIDGGLRHLHRVGMTPHLILGDFDSYEGPLPENAQVFPKEKDYSDLEAALEQLGDEEAVILGVTGGRMDHFLSALSLLQGRENLCIIDEQNQLFYRQGVFSLKKREGYFSLFPEKPMKITIQGAKYELQDHFVTGKDSLLLSNEWREDVHITLEKGWILVVLSRDKKNPR